MVQQQQEEADAAQDGNLPQMLPSVWNLLVQPLSPIALQHIT